LSGFSFDFIVDKKGPHGIAYESWLEREKLAFVVIDVQNYITQKKYSGRWTANGKDEYYYSRLNGVVLPNINKLIERFRSLKLRIVYTGIASHAKTLSDVPGVSRKVLAKELFDADGNQYHLYDDEYPTMIDEQIAPAPEDIVISKAASGVFCSSDIDLILRNNGLSRLVFVGGLTDACVSSSVREAYDRGYLCTVVEDACIAPSAEDHEAALRSLRKYYAWVTNTQELLFHLR
jgi:nicotinamidase-related amidase